MSSSWELKKMSKICPNCRKENGDHSKICSNCNNPLDIDEFIESKQLAIEEILDASSNAGRFNKLINRISSLFGKGNKAEINQEVRDFLILYQKFSGYPKELSDLKSSRIDLKNAKQLKDKYHKDIVELDEFKYLDVLKEDEDLKRMYLELNDIKLFFNNYENKINQFNQLLDESLVKINDVDKFEKEFRELINSKEHIDLKRKNQIIFDYKRIHDFFDRNEISDLPLGEKKVKVEKFMSDYENHSEIIEEHNRKIEESEIEESLKKYGITVDAFNEELDNLKSSGKYIGGSIVNLMKSKYETSYDYIKKHLYQVPLDYQLNNKLDNFTSNYENLDITVKKINSIISRKIIEEEINGNEHLLEEFENDLDELLNCEFYITWKDVEDLKRKYEDFYNIVYQAKTQDKIKLDQEFNKFIDDYNRLDYKVESRNKKYVEEELQLHKDLFDDVENFNLTEKELENPDRIKKSLDANQRRAVVTNELSNQIVAGAGCGKTLTVLGKVRYLTERKGVKPDDILCLSYSNKSVNDLKEKLPDGINTYTFHGLGRSILKANKKPARPDDSALNDFLRIYFKENVLNNEKICEEILDFFAYYLYNPIDEDEVSSLGELYDMEEGRDFRTLRELYGNDNEKVTLDNKTVKSLEELVISNYYFLHQINYQYEKPYEVFNKDYKGQKDFVSKLIYDIDIDLTDKDLSVNLKSLPIIEETGQKIMDFFNIKEYEKDTEYLPDFYLTDYDIYHEHFGVDRNCEAKFLEDEQAQKYQKGIKHKRKLHFEKGTSLMETYSYYMKENRLLERLEEKLKENGVEIKDIDYSYILSQLTERDDVKKFNDFMKLIAGFIELFKGNNYTVDKFEEFREENKSEENEFNKKRNELFLDIAEDVFVSYENYLRSNDKIDFNDMINHATALVNQGKLNKKYRYLIVDEYQDTSYTRYDLLKAIQNQTSAKVSVMGDDWQSIYRFSGCDVSLFKDFDKFFKNPEILTIDTTYRNSQELIDISGEFIKKNPNQIQKSLNSKKKSEKDAKPVKIAYYNQKSNEEKIKVFEYVVNEIAKESNNILVLGRNNFDIDSFLNSDENPSPFREKGQNHEKIIYEKNPDLNIRYITVHSSKGLEEDNIILINLVNKVSGFPNQKMDDPILKFVTSDSDQFEYGEERRLFYVALTRTKNNAYLLSPENNADKSVFVKELEENIEKLDVISKEDIFKDEEAIGENPEDFMKDKKVHSIKTKLNCPVCKTGEIRLVIITKGNKKKMIKFFECSHSRCDWDGGYYNSKIEYIDEIELCPECGSILQPYEGKYGPYLRCNNGKCKHSESMHGEKLERFNKILDKINENAPKEIIKTDLNCPKCDKGKVQLEINKNNDVRHLKCSNESCNWNGGKITISSDDLDLIEPCPSCDGLLIPKKSKKGNKFMGCTNFPECRETHDLPIKNKESSKDTKPEKQPSQNDNIELLESDLICPKCKKGHVRFSIDNGKDKRHFECSEESCNWKSKNVRIVEEDLDKIELCPSCDGLLIPRKSKRGSQFMGCTNFPKCKETHNMTNNGQKVEFRNITKSKWILEQNGTNQTIAKQNIKSENTENDTAAKTKKVQKDKSKTKNEEKSNSEIIETKLKCPECNEGIVILEKEKDKDEGIFKCSKCGYDGGSFNAPLNKLNSLEYCQSEGCNGLTYLRNGRYGEFRTCSNYFKTKCDAGRNKKKNTASKSTSNSKYMRIETKLKCKYCGEKIILMKNKSTGKGFFRCSNNNCDYDGGPFNQSADSLSDLKFCTEPGCDGITYMKNGKYGKFKVCTYFVKTRCKAGKK